MSALGKRLWPDGRVQNCPRLKTAVSRILNLEESIQNSWILFQFWSKTGCFIPYCIVWLLVFIGVCGLPNAAEIFPISSQLLESLENSGDCSLAASRSFSSSNFRYVDFNFQNESCWPENSGCCSPYFLKVPIKKKTTYAKSQCPHQVH